MSDFLKDYAVRKKKAVILGKGPSFERYRDGEFSSDWLICGINQVCMKVPVDLAISSHIEPLEEALECLGGLSGVLVPYYPLYGPNASHDTFYSHHAVLSGLKNVYCYNAYWCTDRIRREDSHAIQSFGTTAHHITQLLALQGVEEFVFYGIDGGRKAYGKKYYADGFNHDPKSYFESGKMPADFDEFWTFYFQLRRKFGLRMTFA